MKKIVRLTESDLHRIVKESVKRILREGKYDLDTGGYDLHARLTDDAFDESETLEDFDKKMKERDYYDGLKAKGAIHRHPQSGHNSLGSHIYAHPEYYYKGQEDDVLNQLERDANTSRKLYGFPS